MGNRLTQIATRTGDNGTTGLGDNTRVSKNSLRVHAMGDVDELNSHLGVLLCEDMPPAVRSLLVEIQHQLFNLGCAGIAAKLSLMLLLYQHHAVAAQTFKDWDTDRQ